MGVKLILAVLCVSVAVINGQGGGSVGGGVPGGQRELEKGGNEARTIAWKSAAEITSQHAQNNGQRHFLPVRIISITKQIVSGTMHRIEVIVGSSNCPTTNTDIVGNYRSLYECGVARDGSYMRCNVSVWSQPWLNSEKITLENCNQASVQEALGQ